MLYWEWRRQLPGIRACMQFAYQLTLSVLPQAEKLSLVLLFNPGSVCARSMGRQHKRAHTSASAAAADRMERQVAQLLTLFPDGGRYTNKGSSIEADH